MPELLREIKKPRWLSQSDGLPRPGSALRDMNVDDRGQLSVWFLGDETRDEDLKRLVAALTVQGGHCEHFSYALVDFDEVLGLGLSVAEGPGTTADSAANQLHRDIVGPSVEQLAGLVSRFMPADRIPPKDVGSLICERMNAGVLARSVLPEDIEEKLVGWKLIEREPHSEEACEEARGALTAALDKWLEAFGAYRAAIEADPATSQEKKLANNLREAKEAGETALGRSRRLWRNHPT